MASFPSNTSTETTAPAGDGFASLLLDAPPASTTMASLPSNTSTETTAPAGDGFAILPLDVIATHILSPDLLPEPGDLGRLRAVSKSMRDAVDKTGRKIEKLSDLDAADLGHLSLVKDRHSRGVLNDEHLLCKAAAAKGDLEALKGLRANDCPWDAWTCAFAAKGGHLEVLQWARANGFLLDWRTCAAAAKGGHLDVLKWARENGCPWD